MNLETREEIAKKLVNYYNIFKNNDNLSKTDMALNIINFIDFLIDKNNLIKEITNFEEMASSIISSIDIFVSEIDHPSLVNMINEKLNILKEL